MSTYAQGYGQELRHYPAGEAFKASFAGGLKLRTPEGYIDGAFKRASTATYVDWEGKLRTAAVDEPRFQDGGLLLEGEGTNLITNSQGRAIEDGFTKATTGTFGDFDIITYTQTTDDYWRRVSGTVSFLLSAGVAYTTSVIAGKSSTGIVRVELYKSSSQSFYIRWNSDGTVVENSIGITIQKKEKRHISGDFYLYSVTFVCDADCTSVAGWGCYGITGDYFELIGLQTEATAFPTSYIPTDGATVTRATEAANNAGNGMSWLLSDELKQIFSDTVASGKGEGTVIFTFSPQYAYQLIQDAGVNTTSFISLADALVGNFLYMNSYNPLNSAADSSYPHLGKTSFNFIPGEVVKAGIRFSSTAGEFGLFGLRNSVLAYGINQSFVGAYSIDMHLRFNYVNEYPLIVKGLSIYDKSLSDEEIEGILGV